jgi:hypothetical protein
MCAPPNKTAVEFVTSPEIARTCDVSAPTVKRRLERAGVTPDGIVIEGRLQTPLFLKARLPQLRSILERTPNER